MNINNYSCENLIKYQTTSPNNISDDYADNFALKSLYGRNFSSSAAMASFANNLHHMYHNQQQNYDQNNAAIDQQYQSYNHAAFSKYSVSYPYTHSSHHTSSSYQPLTPPPQQEDSCSYNHKFEEHLRKDHFGFEIQKAHNYLMGK